MRRPRALERGERKMAPLEPIAPEACFIGIRAELNVCEPNTDHSSGVPKDYLQPKNEFLTKGKLRHECILEEVYRQHFLNVPLALPPCRLPNEVTCKAHPKRVPVNTVFTCPTKARDIERHAPPRGCDFHSPELTVWSELGHVLSAQHAAWAGSKILF